MDEFHKSAYLRGATDILLAFAFFMIEGAVFRLLHLASFVNLDFYMNYWNGLGGVAIGLSLLFANISLAVPLSVKLGFKVHVPTMDSEKKSERVP